VDNNIVEVINGYNSLSFLKEIPPNSTILWDNEGGKPGLKAANHTALLFGVVFCLISQLQTFCQGF